MNSAALGPLVAAAMLCGPVGSLAADADETRVGNGLDHARLARDIVVLDERVGRRVSEIGERIAKQSGRGDIAFTFRIVNDPQINAFATSGGFIYINTGLLDFVDSEAELAAVIAHEVTHISERHLLNHLADAQQKAMSAEVQKFMLMVGMTLLGSAAGVASGAPNGGQLADAGYRLGELMGVSIVDPATQASIFGYRMEQELEADRRAVKLMVDAGYDPMAFVKVLDKMQRLRDKLTASHEPLASGWVNKQPGLERRRSSIEAAIAQGAKR